LSAQERGPRYSLRLSAELRTATRSAIGVTRNVSAGGVCVEIDQPLAEGTELELVLFVVEDDIESADARTLEFRASVQWTSEGDHGHLIGVKFVDPDPSKIAALGNALRVLGLA
jgi:hypothetical protein